MGKCPSCEAVLYRTDLEKNQKRLPQVRHHITASRRAFAWICCSIAKAASRSARK